MIKELLKQITIISDDENDNTENYLEALNYLDNVYNLLEILQNDISMEDVSFLPSFKSMYIAERLGIGSYAEENVLKYFKIKSSLFISDTELSKKIKMDCTPICNKITQEKDVICLVLK
jgi:hypothetical protein